MSAAEKSATAVAKARAYIADPAPDLATYPLLSAEIGITAPDAWQLAQIWLAMADIWRQAAAQIEAWRLGIAAQIEAAATVQEVEAAGVIPRGRN